MIFKLFSARNNPANLSPQQTQKPPWPWSGEVNTPARIRGLISTRVRFLVASRYPIDPEKPDLSSALQELGQTQVQRLAIARLWREEVFAIAGPTK